MFTISYTVFLGWGWVLFAEGEAAGGGSGGFLNLILPILPIIVLFYFLFMRPEQKKRADMQQMLSNLKKNDRVVTIGGILGTVVNVQKDSGEVTLKIDEATNAKLHVIRSSIARIVNDKDAQSKDPQEKTSVLEKR